MADIHSITTIKGASSGLYKEKGSKFHAYLFCAAHLEDVTRELGNLQQQHPKARHHCYAYRIGHEEIAEFASDAGEPSGSAGLPILNTLRSAQVTNVLAVVVRYFGGTKLGIPGLIHAYSEAVKIAFDQNKIVNEELTVQFEIKVNYEKMDTLYKVVSRTRGKILEQQIGTISHFSIEIPQAEEANFIAGCTSEMEIKKG